MVEGVILESNPPHRLVLTWFHTDDKDDTSQVVYEIDQLKDMTRLNIIHSGFKTGSVMAGKVAIGWPLVLSNLKTFLETGTAFDIWAWKTACGKS